MCFPRLLPSTYSIARKGPSSSSTPTSKTVTTFGWLSWALISASRRNRSMAWLRASPATLTTLMATRRLSMGSSARYTVPMPPEPMGLITW